MKRIMEGKDYVTDLLVSCRNVRKGIFEMVKDGTSGHIGSSLSCVEILVCLYEKVMKINPLNVNDINRDRFILSKGHAELAMYSVFEHAGYFKYNEVGKLKRFGSELQGHPHKKFLPCVEFSTGSLGQGLSYAIGQAICGKSMGFNVYVLLGDGELQEGQNYEAAIGALRYLIDNLYVIVDCNGYQLSGESFLTGNSTKMKKVWEELGWNALVINGHSIPEILSAMETHIDGKPNVIFANTIKGQGISFMENNNDYHSRELTAYEILCAIHELQDEVQDE